MEIHIWTRAGKKLATYDPEVETPRAAATLLSRVCRHRPEWVRIGSIVIWSDQIDAIQFPEMEAAP